MLSFCGIFFKKLSYHVEKDVKESLYVNETFLSLRWNIAEKNIIRWSTQYKKYTLLTFILAVLASVNLIYWQPILKELIIKYIPEWRELLSWQSTILAGQLTIIGVVYPLVIGLVSILFQNKSAKKIIFPLYQKYSGFMFAGLSGLSLSTFIILGFFLRPAISQKEYTAICITSGLWFSANLLLTAWFFVKTFRLLEETSREEVILRYAINNASETDVRTRIKNIYLHNAIEQKLLTTPNNDIMKVLTYKYSSDAYEEITKVANKNEVVKDVRLWLLNLAIKAQTLILMLKKQSNTYLIINPQQHRENTNLITLAKYTGFQLNPLVKWMIKHSFLLGRDNSTEHIGLLNVLAGIIGPAVDAIKERDSREFTNAVTTLAEWHSTLANALSFKNANGHADNWLLLSDSNFWGRTFLDELMTDYHRLAKEAVECIPENTRFYTAMLYFHKQIFSKRKIITKQEISPLINGSYYMWYLLMEWRAYNSESNNIKVENKYEDILYDFVGSWESWLVYINPHSKRIADIEKSIPAFISHLENTASTAISALRFGNFDAAGWGVDMLINWLSSLSRDDHFMAEYNWRSVLINHSLLHFNPTSNVWKVILRGHEYNYITAFDIAFKNAHLDLRVLTACYMLLKPNREQPQLLSKYVMALLSGTRIHPSGDVGQSSHKISNAGELLGVYIRHRDYHRSSEPGYGSWLSSILESFGRINEERVVSGRIYSGWGANDPKSMNRAYVEIAMSMSTSLWGLPNSWDEAISSGFYSHQEKQAIIYDLNKWIDIANEDYEYIIIEKSNAKKLKENFIESLSSIINKLTESQVETVSKAEIDKNKLTLIGVAASYIFTNKGINEFPISLFENIERNAELDNKHEYSVNITNYEKESIALNVDANRAINEDEWMARCISNHVKLNILRSLINRQPSESYDYNSIDNTISDILLISMTLACPILLTNNDHLISLLHKSLFEHEISSKFDISHQDGFGNEYICHIGGCEVYMMRFSDIDYSLLTSKEIFKTVRYNSINDNQNVEVNFNQTEDDAISGNLNLKYFMEVIFDEKTPCFKLTLKECDTHGVS